MIGCPYNIVKHFFQAETQVVSILEITLKGCSSALEIPAFHALYDRQGHSDLDCHSRSRKSFHPPRMSKSSTHALDDAATIRFPQLRSQEKYNIIVNRECYL
jgi:hypothetical protein